MILLVIIFLTHPRGNAFPFYTNKRVKRCKTINTVITKNIFFTFDRVFEAMMIYLYVRIIHTYIYIQNLFIPEEILAHKYFDYRRTEKCRCRRRFLKLDETRLVAHSLTFTSDFTYFLINLKKLYVSVRLN